MNNEALETGIAVNNILLKNLDIAEGEILNLLEGKNKKAILDSIKNIRDTKEIINSQSNDYKVALRLKERIQYQDKYMNKQILYPITDKNDDDQLEKILQEFNKRNKNKLEKSHNIWYAVILFSFFSLIAIVMIKVSL